MLFLDFDHVPDDALLTKAEVTVWRRTSIDTVEKDVRAGRLVQIQMSPRRVGIIAGSVRALNRQQASDAVPRDRRRANKYYQRLRIRHRQRGPETIQGNTGEADV